MNYWEFELIGDLPPSMQGQYPAKWDGENLRLTGEILMKRTTWFEGVRLFRNSVHISTTRYPRTKYPKGDTLLLSVNLDLKSCCD